MPDPFSVPSSDTGNPIGNLKSVSPQEGLHRRRIDQNPGPVTSYFGGPEPPSPHVPADRPGRTPQPGRGLIDRQRVMGHRLHTVREGTGNGPLYERL